MGDLPSSSSSARRTRTRRKKPSDPTRRFAVSRTLISAALINRLTLNTTLYDSLSVFTRLVGCIARSDADRRSRASRKRPRRTRVRRVERAAVSICDEDDLYKPEAGNYG